VGLATDHWGERLPIRLRLVAAQTYTSGVVMLAYEPTAQR
jgi:hypothetical protein